jgi:hypothetical protein
MIRHTGLFGELQLLPIGECNFCEILLWFPSWSKLFASLRVVFPIDFVFRLPTNNAFSEDSADLVKCLLVKLAVGMGRRSWNRSWNRS